MQYSPILNTLTVSLQPPAIVRFKVYRLRRRGRRLSHREWINGPTHVGELQSFVRQFKGERYNVLELRPNNPKDDPPIPELYEPSLLGFATLAFRIRGFERAEGPDGAFAVLQEWHCEKP
jgi:hypothetical protein